MAVWQVLAGSTAIIEWQAADQFGEPSDPGVTTAVGVGADGAPFAVGAVSATGTVRSVSFTAPDDPTFITIEWSGGSASGVTVVEVVGGFYFGFPDLALHEPLVSDAVRYRARVPFARAVVEATFEQATGLVFVPRFRWLTAVRGVIRHPQLRSVVLQRTDDGWDTGEVTLRGEWGQVSPDVKRVGCLVGADFPPADVSQAAMRACMNLLTEQSSQVNYQPTMTLTPDGPQAMFGPQLPPWITGDPRVDEVLRRYRYPRAGGTIRVGAAWS